MKSNSIKRLVLLLVAVFTTSGVGFAQSGQDHPRHDRPAHREAKAYYQANVLPVLRRQRQKLETQLTAEDRTQVVTYRTQLQALKQQGRALRQSLAPATAPGATRPTLSDAQRRAIMLNVAQLAQKYDAPIRQLAQEVQPQKEKWSTDLKAIVLKNATPEQRERMAAHGERMHHHGRARRFFKPAIFLLLDPNAAATGQSNERSLGSTSFYPNPAAATSTVEYSVKKAGPVTIDLLDKNGSKLHTLAAETNVEKGAHTQSIDLRDVPAGTYFYKITTKSGSETKRFVKE